MAEAGMSPRRRRRKPAGEEHDAGMERWLLTYSDMITLLLALFVILFALSTINAQKFKAFAEGLARTFANTNHALHTTKSSGLLPQHLGLATPVSSPTVGSTTTTTTTPGSAAAAKANLQNIANQINQALAAAGLSTYATTTVTTQGVVVQMLADKAYFAVDTATLGPVGDHVIDVVSGVLRSIPNKVEVQGYTDNQPITGGPYSSNWELSSVRADNVVQRLISPDSITASRLSAVGYATTHPVVPNTSPANQAQNRRIDVVILTTNVASVGPIGTPSA